LIGVYFDENPGGVDEHAKKREYLFALGKLWNNGITIAPETASTSYVTFGRVLIGSKIHKSSHLVRHTASEHRIATDFLRGEDDRE
jgi:hypothetical protein